MMLIGLLLCAQSGGCTMPGPSLPLGLINYAQSASGEWVWTIAPDPQTNEGGADYELARVKDRKRSTVWGCYLPFHIQHAIATDEGQLFGVAEVARLDPHTQAPYYTVEAIGIGRNGDACVHDTVGDVRNRDDRCLPLSTIVHHQAHQVIFRFSTSEEVGAEEWFVYDTNTGVRSARFDPREKQPDAGRSLTWIYGVIPIAEQPLVLVRWQLETPRTPVKSGEASYGEIGSRFALLALDGDSVWSLDVPRDVGAANSIAHHRRVTFVRGWPGAGMMSFPDGTGFTIKLVGRPDDVQYSLKRAEGAGWNVTELSRSRRRDYTPPSR